MGNIDHVNSNVTVVIRTVGERTEKLCYELVSRQIAEYNIHLIRKTPSTEAIRERFRIGIEEKRKWTLGIDADVLLRSNAIEEIVIFAEKLDNNYFEVEGRILDKFLDSPRHAGNQLFRTALLPQAMKFIPDPYKAIRPDTYIINKMKTKGYLQASSNIIIGLHDYDQYYKDIYRKNYIHAKKHYRRINGYIDYWEKMSTTDNDFKVAIAGFKSGKAGNSKVSIDVSSNFMQDFPSILQSLNLNEKKSIKEEEIIDIEKKIKWLGELSLYFVAINRITLERIMRYAVSKIEKNIAKIYNMVRGLFNI